MELQTFIPTEDIIIKHPEIKVTSMDALVTHIKQREGYFTSTLAGVAYDTANGWEKIEKKGGSIAKRITTSKDPQALFTGANLCDFAAFALADGLKQKTQSAQITVVSLLADFAMESNRAYTEDDRDTHFLVEVAYPDTNETRYFDPTYSQVDHRTAGSIAVFSAKDLAKKYTKTKKTVTLQRVSEEEMNDIKRNLSEFGFTGKDYQAIVQTVL